MKRVVHIELTDTYTWDSFAAGICTANSWRVDPNTGTEWFQRFDPTSPDWQQFSVHFHDDLSPGLTVFTANFINGAWAMCNIFGQPI